MTAVLDPRRKGMMTCSRMPKALDQSPWGTPETLMREMVREWHGAENEFTGNVATEWGERHESQAIAEYEMTTGQEVGYAGMAQMFIKHPHIDWLGGTPDGLVAGTDGMVEAYSPYRVRISHWRQHRSKEIQMRGLLEVTGADWCDFLIWYPEGLIPPSRIERDDAWFRNRGRDERSVLVRLTRFMDTFHKTIESEELSAPHLKPLVDVRTDTEYLEAEAYYNELLHVREGITRQIADGLDEMTRLAGDAERVRGQLGLLSRRSPGASVSYKNALAFYKPDADLKDFTTPAKGGFTWTYRRSGKKEET